MTEIYIELGGKKAIAWSLEWPGWCRIRTSEAAAVQALLETGPRYRLIAQRAGLSFAPGELVVVERLPGNANTAWGVPSVLASAETRPITALTAQRNVALLRASWDLLEEVVAASPQELRKGPRGAMRSARSLSCSPILPGSQGVLLYQLDCCTHNDICDIAGTCHLDIYYSISSK